MAEIKGTHKVAAVAVLLIVCVAGYLLTRDPSPAQPHTQSPDKSTVGPTRLAATTNFDSNDAPATVTTTTPSAETREPTRITQPTAPPTSETSERTETVYPTPTTTQSTISDEPATTQESSGEPMRPAQAEPSPSSSLSPSGIDTEPAAPTFEHAVTTETRQSTPIFARPVGPRTQAPHEQNRDELHNNQVGLAYDEAELTRWVEFKQQFRRQYPSAAEESRRQGIFVGNLRFIRAFNEQSRALYKLDVNQFADFTRDEINAQFVGPTFNWTTTIGAQATVAPVRILSELQSTPPADTAADWRNLTTGDPIDQGTCRDSAVFAVVASLESALNAAINLPVGNGLGSTTSNKVKLSIQQILDCLVLAQQPNKPPVCSGHLSMIDVFDHLEKSGLKLAREHEYLEFKRVQMLGQAPPRSCQLPPELGGGVRACAGNVCGAESHPRLSSYVQVHRDNIQEALLNSSPLVVTLDASQPTFHFYKSGLYHELACSEEHYNTHALLVGYAPAGAAGEAFYTIRASHGTSWGESGYMRLLRDEARNKCLPQSLATYPNVALA